MSETVLVTLGGETVSVAIEGGNMAAGASLVLVDLNSAASRAEQAASDAEAAAASIPALVATKADTDGGNISPSYGDLFRDNISAVSKVYKRAEIGAQNTDLLTYLQQGVPIMPVLWNAAAYVQGVTPVDQSAKFQQMLNAQKTGKTGDVFITKPYYINNFVTIPEDCGIYAVSQGGEEMNKADNASKRPGVIVLGPAGAIFCSNKSRINRVSIISLDAMTQPTTLASAVSRIAAWSNTAVYIPAGASDVDISDNYIVGFDVAINTSNAERHNIVANKIDCHWGVKSTLTFDTSRAEDNHVWPFWPTHIDFPDADPVYGPAAAYKRRGAGFYSQGSNDGWLITNNLVFGFKDGIWFDGSAVLASGENNYANRCRGNWIDNRIGVWGSTVTTGIKVTGAVRLLTLNDNHIDQVEIGMDLDHTPNASGRAGVIATGNTFGACSRRWIRCGAGDGIVQGMMAGGSSGNFGVEFKTGCGYWTFDNIHAVDALNVEAGTGFVPLFGYNGNDLPKINIGSVVAYNNVVYDYRAFGTEVAVRPTVDQAVTANTEVVVTMDIKNTDSLGEFDASVGIFTAKVRGRYILSGCVGFQPVTTALLGYGLYLYSRPFGGSFTKTRLYAQNMVNNTTGLVALPFSDSIHMNAGDSFVLNFVASAAATVKSDGNVTYMRIYRLPTSRA